MGDHKCDVTGCVKSFRKAQGLAVHKFRAHGTPGVGSKGVAAKRPYSKKIRVTVPIAINFCPCCGSRIPNAFTIQGGK